jgi:hypothetical protein
LGEKAFVEYGGSTYTNMGVSMKKFLFITLFLATMGSSLFAALPPLTQNVREIEAILHSNELMDKLNQADVIEMIKHEGNSYIIITEDKRLVVDVVYLSGQKKIGPLEFKLVFHPVTRQ